MERVKSGEIDTLRMFKEVIKEPIPVYKAVKDEYYRVVSIEQEYQPKTTVEEGMPFGRERVLPHFFLTGLNRKYHASFKNQFNISNIYHEKGKKL